MPPVTAPIVHVKVLAAEAVKARFVFAPLQMVFVAAVVITGEGFTVTVIFVTAPVQEPLIDVGTTRYSTDPEETEPGLVKT